MFITYEHTINMNRLLVYYEWIYSGYIEEDIFQAALDTCRNKVIPIRFEVVATEQVYNNQLKKKILKTK